MLSASPNWPYESRSVAAEVSGLRSHNLPFTSRLLSFTCIEVEAGARGFSCTRRPGLESVFVRRVRMREGRLRVDRLSYNLHSKEGSCVCNV